MPRIALPPVINPQPAPSFPIVELSGASMGTTWRVLAVAPRTTAASLERSIASRLDDLVDQMSHWSPASTLSQFNRALAGSWTELPNDFAIVVDTGLRIAGASDGAFDPAAGRLVDLWGYGPPGPRPAPDRTAIDTALARGTWRDLRWDPDTRRLRQPGGLQLDLSGIAKGYAADAVAATLRAAGIAHALVEVGGELVGCGMRPDGDPWWVDLDAPPGVELAPLRVALHGLAVATSGDYVRGAHTLDPRTGTPARFGVTSASVIATSAVVADAWATALTVVSPDVRETLCARHRLAARVVTSDRGGSGEYVSPHLTAMIDPD